MYVLFREVEIYVRDRLHIHQKTKTNDYFQYSICFFCSLTLICTGHFLVHCKIW